MFFLSDLSTFARPKGAKDKRPRRLLRAIWNPNTAGAAATGAGLGWAMGRAATSKYAGERIGILAGTAAGTGLGVINNYRKQNKQ